MPTATLSEATIRLLHLRQDERLGRDGLTRRVGASSSITSRIIARAGLPPLLELDG